MSPVEKKSATVLAAIALFALLPVSGADEFTTFDFGEASTTTSFGTFEAEHDVQAASGLINLYASAVVSGGADVVGRVGATYTLNSGDLLTSFEAFTTTRGTAVGELTCLNVANGTVASLDLQLQKWHEENGNWVLEQTAFVDEWNCPLVTLVNFEPFIGGGTFSYDPGETYRLVVEALARSRAANGSQAITDFCDVNALGCGAAGIPGHILVDLIRIPNQAPVALFQDQEVWFVDALLNGAVVTGRGCDIDGNVENLKVWISELVTWTETTVGAVCGDGQHVVTVSAPATYTGRVEARDDEGAVGSDVGIFRVLLLPPARLMPGVLPDLGNAPATMATLETWLDEEGTILAYRLTRDGVVVAATPIEPVRAAHQATVAYDALASTVSVVLDGHQTWTGPVAAAGEWWDLEPVPLPGLGSLAR